MPQTLTFRDGVFDTNNGTEHYDQICAISEKAINSALVKLFAQRPSSAGEIHWQNEDVSDGQLTSTMLAPQIELDVETVNSLKFKLKLRKPTSTPTEAAAAELEDTAEIVDSNHANSIDLIPGEYSIHRLLAIIAYLDWGSPVWGESYLTKDGTQVYLDQWARDPSNNALYSQVQQLLRELGSSKRHASLLMQNMRVEVPRPKVSPEKVSFPSRRLRLRQYPYTTADKRDELKRAGTPLTGKNGNPYNCLCFCETVGDTWVLPADLLPFCGNFAWPKGDSEFGDDECLGTFVHNQLPLETAPISIHLQNVCLASFVIPLRAHWGKVTASLAERFLYPPYIDHQIDDELEKVILPKLDPTNSFFAMERQSKDQLRWKASRDAPGNNVAVAFLPSAHVFQCYKYIITALSSVIFEKLSDTCFKLTGNCHYDCRYCVGFEADIDMIGDLGGTTCPLDIPWSITIDANNYDPNSPTAIFGNCTTGIEDDSGAEGLKSSELARLVEADPRRASSHGAPDYEYVSHAVLIDEYSKKISRALQGLSNSLDSILRFKYSGSGELSFGLMGISCTSLTGNNAFTPIDYSELNEDRVTWLFSQTNNPQDTKAPVISAVYSSDTSVTKDIPHVTWTSSVAYDTNTKKATLTLKGSNNSNANVAFKSVKAVFLRMKSLNDLPLWNASCDSWSQDATSDSSWSITTDRIAQQLSTKVELINNELQFTIAPHGSDGYADPDRFIVSRNGSFTLNLSGKVNTDGKDDTYVVQLNEDWASVVVIKPLSGRADTFLIIDLKADGSSSSPYVTTQVDADIKRGVPQN
ncbi:hypothetical protein SBOR_10098 [Sclerotinia borealis F-4128]|uniref:Uncharacterized protein n=1 Tax=Sclerotinia borealis (strain F-4128) TaxID=1432307 RepID=W9C0S8_SCLBF|nr:hypothetical protein SBOR_10098 [Sclerotinia borealis F-4128]